MRTQPLPGMIRRLLIIGLGGVLFFWTRIEDNDVLFVAAAGWGTSFLIALLWLLREPRELSRRQFFLGGPLLGTAVGIGAALCTALLMLIKNGLHGHVFPDFPFGVILGILERAPAWSLAGALFGLGLALAWLTLASSNHTE